MRRQYPRPRIRTYRRVETPPGAQSQTDWGEYPRVVLGGEALHAFVMVLSHSRMPAVVWSERGVSPSGGLLRHCRINPSRVPRLPRQLRWPRHAGGVGLLAGGETPRGSAPTPAARRR
jgi:hypothetical protein